MISGLSILLARAKDIFQTEGLASLLRRGFNFVSRWLFRYENYYLCEYTLEERNEADFMPRIHDFATNIICSNKEADELAETAGFDFRRRFVKDKDRLDKGAIAFCVFVGKELAHIGWVALSEEAKKTIDPLPYKVDFANNEACTGGGLTIPKYRGKGLMTYILSRRFQFLKEKGIITARNAVNVNNVASQKVLAKFRPKIYARACSLKLLWWRFWKERPCHSIDGSD